MATQGQPLRRDRFDEMDDDEMIDEMMREMRENDVTSPTSMRTGDDEHEVTMTPAAMSTPQASIDQVLSALRTMKEEMKEMRERERELRERETEMRERERELREENERLRERERERDGSTTDVQC